MSNRRIKLKKRTLVVIILFTFMCNSMLSVESVYAQESNSEEKYTKSIILSDNANGKLIDKTVQDNIDTILDEGYSEKDIDNLSLQVIEEVSDALKADSNSVDINTSVQTFNDIKNIENLINLSEEELAKVYSISIQEAKEIKSELQKIINMSDDELKKELGLDDCDIQLFRKTSEKIENYKRYKKIEDDNLVTLSSSIGTSKLSFTQTVINNSSYNKKNKRTNSKYRVIESFNWKKCYFPWGCGFKDAISVAWSGGYVYSTNSKSVTYYNMYGIIGAYTWASKKKGTKKPSASGKPNTGITYYFDQDYKASMSNIAYVKKGEIQIDLAKSGYSGKKAQIISQYCHKGLGFGSISLSKAPNISVSSSYSTTDTDKTTNLLTY